MKNKNLIFVLMFLLGVVSSSFAHAVTIQNPGFESWTNGMPDGWNVGMSWNGDGNPDSFVVNEYYIAASTGEYCLEGMYSAETHLSSHRGGSVNSNTYYYQRLSGAEPDQTYVFSYWYKHRITGGGDLFGANLGMLAGIDPYGGLDINSADIIWSDSIIPPWLDGEETSWIKTVTATALSSDITIFIRSNNSGYAGRGVLDLHGHLINYGSFSSESFIDSAQITPIPEPATCALFLSGLTGLFFIRRRD